MNALEISSGDIPAINPEITDAASMYAAMYSWPQPFVTAPHT